MKRKHWLIVAGVLSLLYFAGLLYYTRIRGINPDEGFYPLAARLAWEGKLAYRDFLFSQGIVIPYVYGWIWGIHPQSLVWMRFVSAALGALTVFLWGCFLLSAKRLPTGVTLGTFLIILLNPYWIAWHTVVKTFALADLLMSAVMICLYLGFHSGRAKWFAMAGAALGLCASSRALYGPLIPFVLVWLVILDWRESRRSSQVFARRALAWLAGAACGVVPILLSFAADPAAFIFNNFQYRSILDAAVSMTFRQHVRFHLLGLYATVTRPFLAVELLLTLAGIVSLLALRKKQDGPYSRQDYQFGLLAFLMMVVYSATALIPLPTWPQYYDAPLLPFLVVFIAAGLRVAFQSRWRWAGAAVLAILLPILCWRDVRFTVAEASSFPRLQLSSYRQVADVVRANSGPDAVVLSIWPGYVFESGRRCFPGAENQFVYATAAGVSPQLRERYHLVSKREVLEALSAGVPDIYIPAAIGRYIILTVPENEAFLSALKANYSLINMVDDVPIYRRNHQVSGQKALIRRF